jgi:hypothetical protein
MLMFPSFLTKRKKNDANVLLIDVGSASVGAALIELGKGAPPTILTTARENITFQEKLSSAEFLRAMGQALERVLRVSQQKIKNTGAPAHIFCSLSSPWFMLKSRHLLITRQDSFTVGPGELNKLLDEEVERLKIELKETLPIDGMKVVEKKIIQTKLNGYEIKNPYGQNASRVELTMTVGISSKQVTEKIEHTIQKFFHALKIHYGAFPVAAISAIRDIFPTEKSFIFLDITGESTDVSLVNRDLLMGTVTFPRGKNFFIREISSQFRMPHEAAASVLSMYLGGTLDPVRQKETELLMERTQKDWLERFEKTLSTLSNAGTLSRKIYFTADPETSALFSAMLAKANGPNVAKKPFDIQYLDELIFGKFVHFESGVVRDSFLTVEALLAAKVVPQLT